jgi:hypothetical protein
MDVMQLLAALSGGRGGGFGGSSRSERHHTTLDIDAIVTRGKNTPAVEDGTAVEINIGLGTTLTRLVFTRDEGKQFDGTEKPDPYPIAYRTAIWTPNTHMRSSDVQDRHDDLQRGQGVGCIYLPAFALYCKVQYTNDGKVKRNYTTRIENWEEFQTTLDNDLGLVIPICFLVVIYVSLYAFLLHLGV